MENFKIHPVLQNSHLHLWLLFFWYSVELIFVSDWSTLRIQAIFPTYCSVEYLLGLSQRWICFCCTILFFLVFHDYLYVKIKHYSFSKFWLWNGLVFKNQSKPKQTNPSQIYTINSIIWNIPIQILTIKCTGTPKIGSSEKD